MLMEISYANHVHVWCGLDHFAVSLLDIKLIVNAILFLVAITA